MLDALIPLNGIYLRMLLQDLEIDHINLSDTKDDNFGGEIPSLCQSYLTPDDVINLTKSSLDRSLLASESLKQGDDSDEEVILVCLRVLTLLLSRLNIFLLVSQSIIYINILYISDGHQMFEKASV